MNAAGGHFWSNSVRCACWPSSLRTYGHSVCHVDAHGWIDYCIYGRARREPREHSCRNGCCRDHCCDQRTRTTRARARRRRHRRRSFRPSVRSFRLPSVGVGVSSVGGVGVVVYEAWRPTEQFQPRRQAERSSPGASPSATQQPRRKASRDAQRSAERSTHPGHSCPRAPSNRRHLRLLFLVLVFVHREWWWCLPGGQETRRSQQHDPCASGCGAEERHHEQQPRVSG